MKVFFIAVAMLVCVGVTVAQDRPPNLARDGLAGKVRSLRLEKVSFELKGAEGNRQLLQILNFDEHGNRVDATTFMDGAILEKLVYTYDARNRNTGYDEYASIIDKALSRPRHHIYTLDDDAHIVEYVVRETDGAVGSHFKYQYNQKGQKTEESFYTWTGKRAGWLVYTYDDEGHDLTQTSYNSDGTVAWKTVNSYDAQGRQIEWLQFAGAVLKYKRVLKYAGGGRLAERQTVSFLSPGGIEPTHSPVPGSDIYSYNDALRSTEIAHYKPDGSLRDKEVRVVDDKGNETGVTFVDESGTIKHSVSVAIQYDEHGNWIRKVHSVLRKGQEQAQPYYAEFRTIAYYEN